MSRAAVGKVLTPFPGLWSPDGKILVPEHPLIRMERERLIRERAHPKYYQRGVLWVPQKGRLLVEHNTGGVGTLNWGAAVTTGAASGTKGTPVQLTASTGFEAYWVCMMASAYSGAATASQGAFDLLIGASTEAILISNMLMGYATTPGTLGKPGKIWDFPLYIPASSRLAAQAAGARTSTSLRIAYFLYGGDGTPPFRVGSIVSSYGSGAPDGTSLTPGASGVEGAWAQMVASTSNDHFAFVPSFQVTGDTTVSVLGLAVDIGIGAAAAETEIGQSYWFITDASEGMAGPNNSMPTFMDVPSGTRLVMRASASGAIDGGYNGAIHALR